MSRRHRLRTVLVVSRPRRWGQLGWDPRPLSGPSFDDESRPMTDTVRHPGARAAVRSSNNNLYLATDAAPGSIFRVLPS